MQSLTLNTLNDCEHDCELKNAEFERVRFEPTPFPD